MNNGYIKLDRALFDWRYATKPNYVALWIHILLKANHKSKEWENITIQRGQLVTSLESLSKGTGISVQTVRTILKRLNGEELTYKSTNRYTLITILKYDEYQSSDDDTNKQINNQLTNNQQTTNKQLTTNNNVKKDKNDKNIYTYIGNSEELTDAFNDFRDMRKKIKKPLTQRAEMLIAKKLSELSKDEKTQIEILNQSITNSWLNVYPLKNDNNKREDIITTYDTSINPVYDEERFNEIMRKRENVDK